jgi:8-oxo-dGTP diphosphatase
MARSPSRGSTSWHHATKYNAASLYTATNMQRTDHRVPYPMPFTRIELCVLAVVDGALAVLLGRRAEAPAQGKWALPGGVLRIDLDRSLEDAAQRVAQERLGAGLPHLRQQRAVGGPSRDPRAPWALSIVYRGLIDASAVQLDAGKRLESLRWVPADMASQDSTLAFDHELLIAGAAAVLRAELADLHFPDGLMPETFTLTELQQRCEQVLGRSLDKSSFRRRLADRNCVEPVGGEFRVGANRPAQLYRFASPDRT